MILILLFVVCSPETLKLEFRVSLRLEVRILWQASRTADCILWYITSCGYRSKISAAAALAAAVSASSACKKNDVIQYKWPMKGSMTSFLKALYAASLKLCLPDLNIRMDQLFHYFGCLGLWVLELPKFAYFGEFKKFWLQSQNAAKFVMLLADKAYRILKLENIFCLPVWEL